jgi:hypothetical protein
MAVHPRVRIQPEAVTALSQVLAKSAEAQGPVASAWNDPKFWPTNEDRSVRSQLLTIGNALNFRFWRLTSTGVLESLGGRLEGKYFTGSMYMWRRIRLAHDANVPLSDAKYLATMDSATFYDLFVDDEGVNPLAEAMEDRVANLRDLGEQLVTDWSGQFDNVLSKAGGSLPQFMQLSRNFRAFDDPLGKLTLVNALMHRGSGLVSFQEPLLPAIDYQLLKQLLRQRVLIPDRRLDAKLRGSHYLDDNEAHQLRSAALEALLFAGSRTGLAGDLIDNLLWRNRTTCTDVEPNCQDCKFNAFCSKDVDLRRPLQLTRHY